MTEGFRLYPEFRMTRDVDEFRVRPEKWMRYALCTQVDPDLFFPERGGDMGRVADAKAVCEACDVRAQCLAYAMRRGEDEGIWGGLAPRQRLALRRRLEEQRSAA